MSQMDIKGLKRRDIPKQENPCLKEMKPCSLCKKAMTFKENVL